VETQGSDVDLEGTFDQPNLAQSASQVLKVDAGSNRLLGFTQTITRMQGGQPVATTSSNVNYAVDANGSMTSDGLRRFEYDDTGRLAEVQVWKDGEAARVRYLHNALGQRVFKSEPEAEQTLPKEDELGVGFVNWLRKNFGWMFQKGNGARASVGNAFFQGDGEIPGWALLGEYDNGSAAGKGRAEYLWLPVEDGNAVMVGMYRNGKLYAIHTDHLGTPRALSDESKATVWQWPYGGFGTNAPTGVLATQATGRLVATNTPVEFNHRFPGQYYDSESGLFQNWHREYTATMGRYIQSDPIGIAGGINPYSFADADSLRQVDPDGHESITIGLFAGLGAQATFGRNPNGSGFMTLQFGWGIGGGLTYNPLGRQPGHDDCQGASWGSTAGLYAQVNLRAAFAAANAGVNFGRVYRSSGSALYGGPTANANLRDPQGAWGVNATASAGGQLSAFGGGSAQGACTCPR
jgi:RHS repeat-associated protein